MRKLLIISTLAVIGGLMTGCGQNADLKETALSLCQYIPDHCVREDAAEGMSESFYKAVTEAFDAPDGAYEGIGDSEWLYYFVTGNGGGIPVYKVLSVTQHSKKQADAVIEVREIWEEGDDPSESDPSYYPMSIIKQNGRWVIDDFDNKKKECQEYVAELRQKYESGEILDMMREDEYSREYIPKFLADVQEFYKKHGK